MESDAKTHAVRYLTQLRVADFCHIIQRALYWVGVEARQCGSDFGSSALPARDIVLTCFPTSSLRQEFGTAVASPGNETCLPR